MSTIVMKDRNFNFLDSIVPICPTCKQEVRENKNVPTNISAIRAVIKGWKVQSGNDPDDKDWDKAHYKSNIMHAKRLLGLFGGDVGTVLDCIEDRWAQIVTKQGLSLSLAGVVKNSDVFRQRWLEQKEKRGGS